MDALNLAILKFGYKDRIIDLNEITWSGLHETLLKPFTNICEIHGKLFSMNGEPIYVIHGQFGSPVWRKWQIDNQLRCIDRELDGSLNCKRIAQQSFEFLVSYWEEMSRYKIRIDPGQK